ncbi:hypothetical protein BGZ95_004281 [Linnemannia exigua]|uniref:PHD-type domain-containing protein n=1 Tax=Linnemannia exigua TaxID=604196 RepID=A0AAD4H0W2_9FUNG|nr:hypothetical protein BGZ95_004281 [Linnemannia exigua]
MLTSSTTIVHQKAATPISSINGYGPTASLHHPVLETNLSSQPQPQSYSSPAVVKNNTPVQESMPQSTLPVALGQATSQLEPFGSSPTRTKHPQPPQPQEQGQPQRRQSTLQYFQPKDSDRRLSCEDLSQGVLPSGDNNTKTAATTFVSKDWQQKETNQHDHHQQQHHDDKRLVVRLDLRKLGTNGVDVRTPSKKLTTQRNSIRKKSLEGPIVTIPAIGQTTLGAHSWAHAKPAQNGTYTNSSTQDRPIENPREQPQQPDTKVTVQKATVAPAVVKDSSLEPCTINAPITTIDAAATMTTRSSTPDSDLRGDMQSEGDPDYVDTGSRSMKRSNSSGSWTDQNIKKRTRSSNQGAAKKKKVQEERSTQQESQHQEGPALKKKGSIKKMVKASPVPSAPAPAAPAAPVVDQAKDAANSGVDAKVDYPPKPSPKVVANSDGEYEDTVDYKPRPKRSAAANSSSTPAIKADLETLQLHDSQGQIRLCFQCGKSALRDRFMVSCDHCPLHWHLDCLSPPMATPPPSTNKWMCPNHADHVMPRRRKRKDATPIELKDPRAANDGLIEVIPEPALAHPSIWDQDTSGIVYRVPERNIKQSFVEKCSRIREQQQEQQQRNMALSVTQTSIGSASIAIQPFDLLIAAAMADDRVSVSSSQPVSELSLSSNQMDVDREEKYQLQETVLSRMTDPAERQEYQRFRAFQRYLQELGSEEAMKRWLDQQEREKEEIAKQGLLGLL